VRILGRHRKEVLAFTLSALAGAAMLGDFDSERSAARDRTPAPAPRTPAPVPPELVPTTLPQQPSRVLTVSNSPYGRPIQPGFVGLSMEYNAVPAYAGTNPNAVNPVLAHLIRGLAPGQSPVLRIGGDSTDHTWAPTPSVRRPAGIRFTLTHKWVAITRSLARATGARLVLGIDLEANRRALSASEARLLIGGLGRHAIAGLELGNEPELYRSYAWYRTRAGLRVLGRPLSYGFPAFAREFRRFGQALPPLPLAGPAFGGQRWIGFTTRFVRITSDLQLVTVHRYPLERCGLPAASDLYPTIPHLLSDAASRGLAAGVVRYVAAAHARGLPLRVDEMNSVACGGAPGVSDTFASALWGLNTMFEFARVGVDGVNIHTFPRAHYRLFGFTRAGGQWLGRVAPEYFGLMLFAQAAPPGARLLSLTGSVPQLRTWATQAPDRRIRVVLINDSSTRRQIVAVRPSSTAAGAAELVRLTAPALDSRAGVTLGGQSFGRRTATGALTGPPRTATVQRSPGGYVVSVPPASAAMLTLPRH